MPKKPDREERARPGNVTLSLGEDVATMLDDLWRDYVVRGGGRAGSKSEAVRDMIERAHERWIARKAKR